MHVLARLPMLYVDNNDQSGYFSRHLEWEYWNKWQNFKPQWPKRKVTDEVDPKTGKPKIILKYKKPDCLKKIPLRMMPQDFTPRFDRWFYDNRTGEAVIALIKDGKPTEHIRVYDPMWLVNLSETDIKTLYHAEFLYLAQDIEQALVYPRVIRVCYAFGVHSGSCWSGKHFVKPKKIEWPRKD
jgi:hypothetical protein